ncbi:hypothetical protein C0J52_27238 [Blattella germanica]|nr:hypothetical protein C0J52_27238 [Blattella germanica]
MQGARVHSFSCCSLKSTSTCTVHPFFLFLHGCVIVSEKSSNSNILMGVKLPRQVGHLSNRGLQELQILCPFSHTVMGLVLYSKQKGHFKLSRKIS